MSIKKVIIETVETEIEVEIKDEWGCSMCGELMQVEFSYPRDYGKAIDCESCETRDMYIDGEWVAGYDVSHLDLVLSKDGYEWEVK